MNQSNSSMQLTRAADYGVRVMVYLAGLPEGERTLLPQLAEATGTPESFLSKVLQALTRAQLISSWRGKSGGFAILPQGRSASLYDVIEAVEGPIRLNLCLVSGKSCGRMPNCPAHPVWARAQQAMMDVLTSASISEMAGEAAAPHCAAGLETLMPIRKSARR